MSYVCSICQREPSSHSFVHLAEEDGENIFYSCPYLAKKYYDGEGIHMHIDDTLHYYQAESQPWKWIFDADGFGLTHALEISTAIGLANLITEKYSTPLKQILIVNSNWYIRIVLTIVLPFLNERVQGIVKVVDRHPYIHLIPHYSL